MNRSDYTYEFHEFDVDPKFTGSAKERVLAITDLNIGGKSVTNDFENIIAEIMADDPFNAFVPVVYCDSEGDWMLVLVTSLEPVEIGFLPGVHDFLDGALQAAIARWKWQSQNNSYGINFHGKKYDVKNQSELFNLIKEK